VLLFSHIGIALGASTIISGGINREKLAWFDKLSKYLDIRFLVIGSMLPDIIDKPVGQYFFRDTFQNGRIFSHSLLFFLVITALGYYLWRKQHRTWLLALAAGTLTHLVLDSMWRVPKTLFWPVMGWSFPKIELENWAGGIWHALFHEPGVYIPEIIGLAVVLWFAVWVIWRRKAGVFLKYGRVS
jgi:inner membrane protein